MTHAVVLALALAAAGEVSIDRGKALFSDPDLGVNAKTCVLCHAGGTSFDPEELRAATPKDVGLLINHCLSLRMKTPRLAADSADLKALILYVKTFQQKGR